MAIFWIGVRLRRPVFIGQVHLNLPLCEFDFLNTHVHIRLGSARTQPSMTVICLTFWQNCRNVVSLEDKYLDCSPFGEEVIFLSVTKMGDGIVVDVAAGIVICQVYYRCL